MTGIEMLQANFAPCIDMAARVIADIISTLGDELWEPEQLSHCSYWTQELIDLMSSDCITLCALGEGVEAWYATFTVRCATIIGNLYLFQDTLMPAHRVVCTQSSLISHARVLLDEILAELNKAKADVSIAWDTEGPTVAVPLDQQLANVSMENSQRVIKGVKFQTAQAVRVIAELSDSLDHCVLRLSADDESVNGTTLCVSDVGSRAIPICAMRRAEDSLELMAEGRGVVYTHGMNEAGKRTLAVFTSAKSTIFNDDFIPALTRYTMTHDALVTLFRERIRGLARFLDTACERYEGADAAAAAAL